MGLRWSSLQGEFAWVLEVLSNGRLDEWGKTAHSTQRRTAIPTILQEDLAEWRAALNTAGDPSARLHPEQSKRLIADNNPSNYSRSWCSLPTR